jgi:hypothetical protein
MATVFGVRDIKMKDAAFCIDMYNSIINDQKDLAILATLAYEKLQKDNPGKFNGKDFLLKDYVENIRKLDAEFKRFVEFVEKYESKRFRIRSSRKVEDIQREVENKITGDAISEVEALKKLMTETFTKNKINFRKLAQACQDPNYKNFERAILKNTEILTTWTKNNVIAKANNVKV